jgi:hypothetical protein
MTYLEQVVSTLMHAGHSPDEIIRAAERAVTGERIEERVDMVAFAGRLCRMDENDWRENR